VNVTVWLIAVAEQIEGAPVLLLVSTPPQPPEPEAVASHALYCAVNWACVKQGLDAVALTGQLSTTGGVDDTEKLA
jgi:hypothetical protein